MGAVGRQAQGQQGDVGEVFGEGVGLPCLTILLYGIESGRDFDAVQKTVSEI